MLGMADVVVMAGKVERHEDPAVGLPARVLAVFPWLDLDPGGGLAEKLPPSRQPFEGLAAIAPFVIAGKEDERMPDARELALARLEPGVAASLPARADVADVHYEGERLGVHLVDQPVEPLHLVGGVGRVSQQPEIDLAGRLRGGRAAGEQQKN